MTEPQQPDTGSTPEPPAGQPAGQVPTPPPSPYEVPPLPGGEAPATSPATTYPPQAQQATAPQGYQQQGPAPQGYPQPSYSEQPYPQPPYPGQPQQPYGVYGAPQPYDQSYSQQPYGHVPPQPYGAQPPYPPYPTQPPYHNPSEPPHKKKAWPWVLAGCLVIFLLGIGGCVSCTTVAAIIGAQEYRNSGSYIDSYDDYGYDSYDDYNYDSTDPDAQLGLFTLDDIKSTLEPESGKVVDGRCQPGLYVVGANKDIKPGTYFFEGSQDDEDDFFMFQSEGSDSYSLTATVVYFGNYFAELEEGDIIVFEADSTKRFYPAGMAEFKAAAPYQSGLYRVGTDLPAGTYALDINSEAAADAQQDCAAFVMQDLSFDEDSITDTKYLMRGGTQTITVKDGDYLELYATTATPVDAAK